MSGARQRSCIKIYAVIMERAYGIVWLNEGIVACYHLRCRRARSLKCQRCQLSSTAEFRKKSTAWSYALRKTILPIRPKPLIPTSVSDILGDGACEPSRKGRGVERGICRLKLEEKFSVGIESFGWSVIFPFAETPLVRQDRHRWVTKL